MPLIGSGLLSASGAPAFVGAYDGISNLAAVYSVRRVLTSYTGPLLRLRRDSDNAESDFGYVSNGDLDTAAIATWLGAATPYVTTWYDQGTSSRHVTKAMAAAQPAYSDSKIVFPQATAQLTNGWTFSGPVDWIMVNSPDVATASNFYGIAGGYQYGHYSIIVDGTAGNWRLYSGSFGATFALGTPSTHILSVEWDTTTVTRQNGTQKSSYAQTMMETSSFCLGDRGGYALQSSNFRNINHAMREFVIGNFSTADHNTIGSSMAAYYGLTWNTIA